MISIFFFWTLWREISDWKKRLKIKVKENLNKINYDLSELDLEARIKKDCSSMIDKNMTLIMGIVWNISSFIFLLLFNYEIL